MLGIIAVARVQQRKLLLNFRISRWMVHCFRPPISTWRLLERNTLSYMAGARARVSQRRRARCLRETPASHGRCTCTRVAEAARAGERHLPYMAGACARASQRRRGALDCCLKWQVHVHARRRGGACVRETPALHGRYTCTRVAEAARSSRLLP